MGGAKKKKPGTEKVLVGTRLMSLLRSQYKTRPFADMRTCTFLITFSGVSGFVLSPTSIVTSDLTRNNSARLLDWKSYRLHHSHSKILFVFTQEINTTR